MSFLDSLRSLGVWDSGQFSALCKVIICSNKGSKTNFLYFKELSQPGLKKEILPNSFFPLQFVPSTSTTHVRNNLQKFATWSRHFRPGSWRDSAFRRILFRNPFSAGQFLLLSHDRTLAKSFTFFSRKVEVIFLPKNSNSEVSNKRREFSEDQIPRAAIRSARKGFALINQKSASLRALTKTGAFQC